MNAPDTAALRGEAAPSEQMRQLLELIAAKLPPEQAAEVAEFVRQYYGQVAPEDLAERALADLYGAALSHWHFARVFAGGKPKLRVYNPRLEEHGWQSTHTVIEIVNDDMPFLVDSITMEVNRQGLTLHLIVHPVLKLRRDAQSRMTGIARERDEAEGRFESLIHVEVDRRTAPAQLEALQDGLERILGDVRAAVQDWKRDAATADRDRCRARAQSAAGAARRPRRGPRVPALARRRQLHVARLPRLRPGAGRRRGHLAHRRPARGSASCARPASRRTRRNRRRSPRCRPRCARRRVSRGCWC